MTRTRAPKAPTRPPGRRGAALAAVGILCLPAWSGVFAGEKLPTGAQRPSTVTVEDGVGRRVTVPASPKRVVSLAPSVTEIFSALGAWDLLVGITNYGRVPDGARAPARIGGLINPDLERIVSLKPDLAVATTAGNYRDDADRIERLGIPVYTLDVPSFAGVLESVEKMGSLLGRSAAAGELVASMRARVDAVRKSVAGKSRPAVLFIVWDKPIIAPGRDAFVTEALETAGARSVTADAPGKWPEVDLETILAARPEVILTVPHQRALAESLPDRPAWSTVPAVRNGRIYVVSEDIEQPGPRIVDGIEEVAKLLHGRAASGTSSAPP